MGIEIEKKYRLTREEHELLQLRLHEIKAEKKGEEFEENILFAGGVLSERACVLRLRRVGNSALLTYKERFPSSSAIKRQREDETGVEDPKAMLDILNALGFTPALVYEKRRSTWRVGETEVAVDELPFGLFAEIEGEEEEIEKAEEFLGLSNSKAELATYPQLTHKFGKERDGIIEARFKKP